MTEVIDRVAERRADARAMALLALILTVLYADVIFLGATFFLRDLTCYHYPMKWVVREIILGGDFPFWNRLYSAGQPLAANPAYEVFYPPQWLTLLPDYNLGFRLHIVVHVFIAALGGFRFLRSIGLAVTASFIGAMVFVTAGPYVSTINLLPFLFSISWTPWIAIYARKWLLERERRDFVLAALFLGMQALLCEPTTLLQTWGVIGAYAAFAGWRRDGARAAVESFSRAVLLVLSGVLVAAIQFLPAADHARDSVRLLGFPLEVATKWSFHPWRILELVFPNLFGTIEALGPLYWGAQLYPGAGGPYLYSAYVSLAIIALVFVAAFLRVPGRGFAAIVAVPSFLLAMGGHTPLFLLLYRSGLLPSIRYPEKFLFAGTFAFIVYGAIAFDRILRGDTGLARHAARFCGAAAIVAVVLFLACFHPSYSDWFAAFWKVSDAGPQAIARTQWLIAGVRGFAFAFAFWALSRLASRKQIALMALLLIADLAPLGNQINPRVPRDFFDEPPPLAQSLEPAGARLVHVASMQIEAAETRKYSRSNTVYWVLRNGLWPATPARWGIPTCLEFDIDETQLLQTRGVLLLANQLAANGVVDWLSAIGPMYGAGPVLVYRDPDKELGRIAGDPSAIDPVVLARTAHYPRYYLASQMVNAADPTQLLELLTTNRWDSRTAFVKAGARPVAEGRVVAAREGANRTELEVETVGDAFVVLSSTHHKYWRAALDGRSVPITETNLAFQGIAVPRGRHRIILEYRNPLIAVGALISALAVAALGWVWMSAGAGTRGPAVTG